MANWCGGHRLLLSLVLVLVFSPDAEYQAAGAEIADAGVARRNDGQGQHNRDGPNFRRQILFIIFILLPIHYKPRGLVNSGCTALRRDITDDAGGPLAPMRRWLVGAVEEGVAFINAGGAA